MLAEPAMFLCVGEDQGGQKKSQDIADIVGKGPNTYVSFFR